MDESAASRYRCLACGRVLDSADPRDCPDCGGGLAVVPDDDGLDPEVLDGGLEEPDRARLLGADPVDLGQGDTPLVAGPDIAAAIGVATLAVKDEAHNPSGALVDRELGLAVGAARNAGADTVRLPTMGNGGQAAAMAAARAGLESHSFAPSRTPFVNKAMINVHAGDMTVVEGRYRDAEAAYFDADGGGYPLAPFAAPFRHAGAKPIAYELVTEDDRAPPEVVIVPTGQVTAVVGIHQGFRDLAELGLVDELPRLVAAQAADCAPLAEAIAAGREDPVAVEHPDTVVGPLEIPDPAGGAAAIEAIRASGGTAVGVPDPDILAGAETLAAAGLPASVTGGAGLAAIERLVDRGAIGEADEVVLVNPIAGSKEADLLRSHLMSQGR